MKLIIVFLFFVSWSLGTSFCQDKAVGLIVHKQFASSADSSAKIQEFEKINEGATSVSFYPLGSRSQKLVTKDKVIAVIHYLDLKSGSISQPPEIQKLKETGILMQKTAARFPKAKELLEAHYREAAEAMTKINSGMILVSGTWQKRPESNPSGAPVLEITLADGSVKKFEGGKIIGKTPAGLRIMHAAGATSIPFEQLSEKHRKEHGYDAAEAEAYRKSLVAQSVPMGKKTSEADVLTGEWDHKKALETFLNSPEHVSKMILAHFNGIWTYTGTGMPDGKGNYLWLRVTIPKSPSESILVQYAEPIESKWGEGIKVPVEVISEKYVDTGERWIALKGYGTSSQFTVTKTGELVYYNEVAGLNNLVGIEDRIDRAVLDKKDVSPFSQ